MAATTAGLVPPYLTIPLWDKVLIPYQEHKLASFAAVPWILLGLVGASICAWLLSWARTYVLAWVAERISGDLRDRAYAHLHNLSLDFFSGKRTGDLISRIGSDSDRICFFLPIYLLDFAGDILMIAMTAAILLRLDPTLAVLTLCPLPLIAYLVHRVRNKLRRGFPPGQRRLGPHDQRAGRHHSRHPRGEGLRPGTPRDRPLRPGQRSGVAGQRPGERDVVVLRADGGAADRLRGAGDLGLRRLADLSAQHDGGRADGIPGLYRPLLRPAGFDEPDGLGGAAGGGQLAADFEVWIRCPAWRSR